MNHFISDSNASLSQKAALLRLKAFSISESMKIGSFRSLYKGKGAEFCGVRRYLYADDIRSIDWNVSARMGKPYIKLFEEEKEFELFIIIDQSFSMLTGSEGRIRYKTAAETAALLITAAQLNRCPSGALFFNKEISRTFIPKCSKKQTMLLLSCLDKAENIKTGSCLTEALSAAVRLLKKRSLVFVISDFRCSGWKKPFKILASRNNVSAMLITDPCEQELSGTGYIHFSDPETNVKAAFPLSSNLFKKLWKNEYLLRKKNICEFCRKNAADFLSISTDENVFQKLLFFFGKGK